MLGRGKLTGQGLSQTVHHGILPRMPRRSKKILTARHHKAQEQMLALLEMTPAKISEEYLRRAEEEIARFEPMSDKELEAYYRTPEGIAEIAEYRELEREFKEWETTPIEQRSNPLGRKLIRRGKLEFYLEINARVVRGMPRKKIVDELSLLYRKRISANTIKVALRALRKLTRQDYRHHSHRGVDFNHCPQCRGYAYQGRNLHGEDRRRLQRKKKIDEIVRADSDRLERLADETESEESGI
jgi:hypothetical protein